MELHKIKWGIIGLGSIARSFANDFKYTSGGTIVAAASRSHEKASAFCQEFGIEKAYGYYEEILLDKDIDVVYIATPHNFHFQNVSDAMNAGKAVLCEKPITINLEECGKLIEVAKSTNSYLMEAMWTYFLPPILKVQEWVKAGKIGKLKYIKADFAFKADFNPDGRLFNPALAGGALLDIGIYPIALATLITDATPEKISVFPIKAETGVDLEETMIFEYDDDVKANLLSSLAYKTPYDALIVGSEGYIRIPDFFMSKESFLYRDDRQIEHFEDKREAVGYNYEIEAVQRDLVQGKLESEIMPLNFSMRLQHILEKVKAKF